MSKLNNWITGTDDGFTWYRLAMWPGLILALSVGTICAVQLMRHPTLAAAIPEAVLIFIWYRLLRVSK